MSPVRYNFIQIISTSRAFFAGRQLQGIGNKSDRITESTLGSIIVWTLPANADMGRPPIQIESATYGIFFGCRGCMNAPIDGHVVSTVNDDVVSHPSSRAYTPEGK